MELNYEKLTYQEKAVTAVIDTLSGHDETVNSIEIDPSALDDSIRVTLSENKQNYPEQWELKFSFKDNNVIKVAEILTVGGNTSYTEKNESEQIIYNTVFSQLNIEMETGTGKTMVYLRTIMD